MIQSNHSCVPWALYTWPQIQLQNETVGDFEEVTSDVASRSSSMEGIEQEISGSDQEQTSVKQLFTPNPHLDQEDEETIIKIPLSSPQSGNTPLRPTRSAYRLAETANNRVNNLEQSMCNMLGHFLEHSSKVENALQKLQDAKDNDLREKDCKILNLREEIQTLKDELAVMNANNDSFVEELQIAKLKVK